MDEKHGSPGSPNGKRYNAAIFKIVMFVVEEDPRRQGMILTRSWSASMPLRAPQDSDRYFLLFLF
jgi:hypothetical protein